MVVVEHSDEDWYANLLWLEGKRCLLVAHARTLFSVFVPRVRKADLVPIGASLVTLIQRELGAEGLPLDQLGVLDPRSVALAKTASRSVLGYVNDMALACEYAIDESGGLAYTDIRKLNRALRRELHLSRRPPGYLFPSSWLVDHQFETRHQSPVAPEACQVTRVLFSMDSRPLKLTAGERLMTPVATGPN